ncbi:LRR receptor-like serine/threonine-protein kinase EFR [Morella rubra]|uniref:LRR receptor-like serine/threonine-protein kinase EFR n=1 Tax=Morella rubra TaxID=262757 RepID=A0A6A1W7T8_9ROSI|nr:LRR receptor-like serine/threonine-protein kinase EFR [Morella rubra]
MLTSLYLSDNHFEGEIPSEVGNLQNLELAYLDLAHNSFSGFILETGGNLRLLQWLNPGYNKLLVESTEFFRRDSQVLISDRLEGANPKSFGELVSLAILGLSNNSLSREIPKSLEVLSYLKYLNVSFNRLRGEVPMGGPFENFTAVSFLSNDPLCGATRLQLPPYETQAQKTTSKRMLKFILPTIGLTILVLVLVLVWTRCNKRNAKSTLVDAKLSLLVQWRRISHQELIQATDRFSLNNLLGEGSFGLVYKGTLSDGMNIATKVLNLQVEGAFKSFDAECERLNIVINVASALEYLHHGYSTSIVHCDLKPSNVLLDEDMVAYVADFGIAKLLGDGDSMTWTMTLATTGYMAPGNF